MPNETLGFKINIKTILKFTLPAIFTMVVMSLYVVVDGIMVSAFIGTDAFSAVNIVYPIINLFVAFGTMFGAGGTAIIAKKIAEKDGKNAREIFSFVMLFGFLFSLLASFVISIFIQPIIYFLGSDDTIYTYCYDYASKIIIFLPLIVPQIIYQSIFPANGKPLLGLISTIGGGVVNIVFDYIFICVFDMGISGAGLATGLGYCLSASFGTLYFLFNKKGNIHFTVPKPNFSALLKTCANGSSEMVTNLAIAITTVLFNVIMMNHYGSDGVAAISAVLYCDFILISIAVGYSLGIAPIVAFNYGARQPQKLNSVIRISLIINLAIGVLTAIITMIFAKPMCSLFTENNAYVLEIATFGMRIFAFSYVFKCINIFISSMFTALSNGKISAFLSLLRTLVFRCACTLALVAIFGINGLWFALPIAELLGIVISLIFVFALKNKYGYGNIFKKL